MELVLQGGESDHKVTLPPASEAKIRDSRDRICFHYTVATLRSSKQREYPAKLSIAPTKIALVTLSSPFVSAYRVSGSTLRQGKRQMTRRRGRTKIRGKSRNRSERRINTRGKDCLEQMAFLACCGLPCTCGAS